MNILTTLTKTIFIFLSVTSLFISHFSYAGGSDAFWISRTHANLGKIDNYRATIEQKQSNSATKVTSEVLFQQPNNFHLAISQPSELAGIEVGFDNHKILMHNPNSQQALKIIGLKSPTEESKLEQVKSIYWFNKEHYDQIFTPSINIAERLSVGLDFIAKDGKAEIKKTETFVDYHHSIFMQASFSFSSGVTSTFTHKTISFNQEMINLPSLKVPKITDIAYWDFNRASLSDKQADNQISPAIHWPEDKEDVWGFAQRQFYQQKNAKTAAAYFYNDAFFMIALTRPAEENVQLMQGVPLILSDTPANLSQFPSFSDLSFAFNGIHYTLLSNIHPQGLINMAKAITTKEKTGENFYLSTD